MTGGNNAGGNGQYTAATTTTSFSSGGMTVGPKASLLVGLAVLGNNTPAPTQLVMTWGSASMNFAGGIWCPNDLAGGAYLFVLCNPQPGNLLLNASWLNGAMTLLSAASFTGTDTVVGIKATDTVMGQNVGPNTPNFSINTDPLGATLALLACNINTAPLMNQPGILQAGHTAVNGYASYALGGVGQNFHAFGPQVSNQNAWVGIHILAAGASAPQESPRPTRRIFLGTPFSLLRNQYGDTTSLVAAVSGSAAISEGADLAAGAGSVAVQGVAAITEGAYTSNGVGVPSVQGVAAIAEGSDTATGVGVDTVYGVAAISEGGDVAAAVGGVAVQGIASISEGADLAAGAGSVAVQGVAAITEGADSATAAGVAGALGAASITEGSDTVTASGAVAVQGVAAITEGLDASAGVGGVAVQGVAAIIEGGDISAGVGFVGQLGAAAITEGADTVTASGGVAVQGVAAIAEGADTSAGIGTVKVAGVAAISEGADAAAGVGVPSVQGVAAISEGADAVGAAGTVAVQGVAAIAEGGDSAAASGTVKVFGIAAITESADQVAAAGFAALLGAAAITEGADQASGVGVTLTGIIGVAAIVEGPDTVTANQSLPALAAAAQVSPDLDAVLADFISFLQGVIGSDVPILRGLNNRVPMPSGPFILVTALDEDRQATNVDSDIDGHFTLPAIPDQTQSEQSTRLEIRVDFYGPDSSDWVTMVETLIRDEYSCDALGFLCQPLYADEARMLPLITAEGQYLEHWLLIVSVQVNPVVVTAQTFSTTLDAIAILVDERFPPGA